MSKNETGKPLSWIERLVLKAVFNKLIKKLIAMKILKGSWFTSLMGWLVLIAACINLLIALIDGDPLTKPDPVAVENALGLLGLAVPSWLGLLRARDKGVSTEAQRDAGTDVK